MKPKIGKSSKGKPMHYSVGALIKQNNKYLLIDRKIFPFGYAGIAGHIDENETPEQALRRELKEESNLDLDSYKLIFEEEIDNNECVMGIKTHYWYLFDCKVSGEIKINPQEVKSYGWFTEQEIEKLNLEPIWKYWFSKLKQKTI